MTFHIMLPFWGSFEHFREAVESVLAQTDPDWKLTVVDDVYPDLAPGEWLQALGDPRIEYIRNEVNLGVSRNYVKCVGLMQGEYSMLFGCDDVMLPGYLARVKELLTRHPGAAVIQPGVEVIDGDGVVSEPLVDRVKNRSRLSGAGARVYSGEVLAHSLLRGNWTYFPALVWKVELLRTYGFNQKLDVVQDLIMLLDIIEGGGEFVLDDEVVFRYRRHQQSVSSATATDGSRFKQERELFDAEVKRFEAIGWRRAARAARWHTLSRLNALTRIPLAVRQGNGKGVKALLTHAAGGHIQ
ncbi:glycosyltransferase involved in cell wall biosynthesis [Conyzicola lurida]|uniref:Glycosyltransferase involved in cell wall biosynthesis n=1 Tax=Conyzicola lurida TaxID=1172621 RepID=A0A841AR17_9MICO|nr:glycosyltransferase involved in cell wall biosynthesis [Conyzicola lurida]